MNSSVDKYFRPFKAVSLPADCHLGDRGLIPHCMEKEMRKYTILHFWRCEKQSYSVQKAQGAVLWNCSLFGRTWFKGDTCFVRLSQKNKQELLFRSSTFQDFSISFPGGDDASPEFLNTMLIYHLLLISSWRYPRSHHCQLPLGSENVIEIQDLTFQVSAQSYSI